MKGSCDCVISLDGNDILSLLNECSMGSMNSKQTAFFNNNSTSKSEFKKNLKKLVKLIKNN